MLCMDLRARSCCKRITAGIVSLVPLMLSFDEMNISQAVLAYMPHCSPYRESICATGYSVFKVHERKILLSITVTINLHLLTNKLKFFQKIF